MTTAELRHPDAPRCRGRPATGWADLPDEALLDVRLCDLGLTIEGSWLEGALARFLRRARRARPHVPAALWLSSEWFSPDGVPGIAIPFYLAHPRLMRLEEAQMLEVEGGTPEWCLKILRHEAGHAFDNAYELRKRRRARQAVRIAVGDYPDFYLPRPYSKSFVLHLDSLVRAEPSGRGLCRDVRRLAHARQRLARALRRLAGAAEARIHGRADARDRRQAAGGRTRRTRRAARAAAARRCASTTRRSAQHYGVDYPNFYDRDLRRLFSDAPEYTRRTARRRASSSRSAATCAGSSPSGPASYQYTIDRVIEDMVTRARRAEPAPEISRWTARSSTSRCCVTVQTMNHLHSGRHRVAL